MSDTVHYSNSEERNVTCRTMIGDWSAFNTIIIRKIRIQKITGESAVRPLARRTFSNTTVRAMGGKVSVKGKLLRCMMEAVYKLSVIR